MGCRTIRASPSAEPVVSMHTAGPRPHPPFEVRSTEPVHVWVRSGASSSPGLLLMWRQRRGRWEGWVVEARYVGAHEHLSVVQSWVEAGSIERVE